MCGMVKSLLAPAYHYSIDFDHFSTSNYLDQVPHFLKKYYTTWHCFSQHCFCQTSSDRLASSACRVLSFSLDVASRIHSAHLNLLDGPFTLSESSETVCWSSSCLRRIFLRARISGARVGIFAAAWLLSALVLAAAASFCSFVQALACRSCIYMIE